VEQVASLYAGSGAVIEDGYPNKYVVVEELGYTYQYSRICSYAGCSTNSVHHIYATSATASTQEFDGEIVVENPAKRTKSYTI